MLSDLQARRISFFFHTSYREYIFAYTRCIIYLGYRTTRGDGVAQVCATIDVYQVYRILAKLFSVPPGPPSPLRAAPTTFLGTDDLEVV